MSTVLISETLPFSGSGKTPLYRDRIPVFCVIPTVALANVLNDVFCYFLRNNKSSCANFKALVMLCSSLKSACQQHAAP